MNEMPMGGGAAPAWFSAPAAFVGMWIVMMVPMMLPSLLPTLWRYRQAMAPRLQRPGAAMALVGIGYFFAWTIFGAAVFPLNVALTRLSPLASGLIVAGAGAWQLTPWKAYHLASCRQWPHGHASSAWRHGTHLGLDCVRSCGNLMIIPLAFGAMDIRTMALISIAITVERLTPTYVARSIGIATIAIGILVATAELR